MKAVSAVPVGFRRMAAVVGLGLVSFAVASSGGQVVVVPSTPVVGSSNPATAEPPVSRPSTTPCVVTLFGNQKFGDYSAKPMTYTPPAGCNGPWAKVVLTIDFTVTQGRQFDRTASLYLGNANIFYGTTAEPRSTLSPSWHVERDVTDLSPVFMSAQTGQAIVYNIVNSTYTGIIYGTAKLYFYPADILNPPAAVPQAVVPVSGTNSPYELDTTSSEVKTSFTAPRNTVKAYLDVISQSQSNDEFWYTCVPSDVAGLLESCGNTPFRETEVTIDGKAAGVAPVYPWIYTGGIDPYLWEPITGIQTLNFKPYRVNLTPFAGMLSDGNQHTIGVSVYNANSYFLATANLLLYTDSGLAQTGGEVEENTLSAAPMPQVAENLSTDSSGNTTGTVTVQSMRKFTVKGYVNTSAGRVETTVDQQVHFNSAQTFNVNSTQGVPDDQNIDQVSTVDTTTTEQTGMLTNTSNTSFSFPLTLIYHFDSNSIGGYTQYTNVDQRFVVKESATLNGMPKTSSNISEEVQSSDNLFYNSSLSAITGHSGAQSSASYVSKDSAGNCYSRQIASSDNVLTSVVDGTGCPANHK